MVPDSPGPAGTAMSDQHQEDSPPSCPAPTSSENAITPKIADTTRRRKWSPKVKTGCLTCRTRRVKCDERKPECWQCLSLGKICEGTLYGAGAAGKSTGSTDGADLRDTHGELFLKRRTRKRTEPSSVLTGLPPENWQVIESYAFLNRVTSTYIAFECAIPNKYTADHDDDEKVTVVDPARDCFVATAFAYRIISISKFHSIELRPSESYNTSHLWTRFYARIQSSLHAVNKDLARGDSSTCRHVLRKIVMMMQLETMLGISSWRLHMDGILAFLDFYGGLRRVVEMRLCGIVYVHCPVINAITANTVASSKNQIIGVSRLDASEILYIYSTILCPMLPCPTILFMEMLSISQLRTESHSSASSTAVILPAAKAILNRINAFSPKSWTETYTLPNVPEVPLLANIFKLAVGLYLLVTLPAAVRHSLFGSTDSARVTYRNKLLGLIKTAWRLKGCVSGLIWPLAVVGFALSDGAEADQALVCSYLMKFTEDPSGSRGAVVTRERLMAFWASGKTAWDDCWTEPFLILL